MTKMKREVAHLWRSTKEHNSFPFLYEIWHT